MNRLAGKKALITGGTSGIGLAIARLFADEGARVIVTGRDQRKADSIDQSKIDFYKCDVTKEDEVIGLKDYVVKTYKSIDILVNNAGVLLTDPVETIKTQDWDLTFKTNTESVMLMTKHFIDLLLSHEDNSTSCIINNTSIDGLQSLNRGRASYAYSSSKAATIKFTQLCALNYADKGVRINCLCPGVTETNLFTNRDFSRFLGAIPMGRVAKAEEIAKSALFLASDDASYITGCILTVDGGASLK